MPLSRGSYYPQRAITISKAIKDEICLINRKHASDVGGSSRCLPVIDFGGSELPCHLSGDPSRYLQFENLAARQNGTARLPGSCLLSATIDGRQGLTGID